MIAPDISIKKRLLFILVFMIFISIALVTRLFWLQVVLGDKFKEKAFEQWTLDVAIMPKRGIIYDRNYKELALSASAGRIYAIPKQIEKPEEVAKKLASILEMDEKSILDKISDKKNQQVVLKKQVPKEKVDEILKLNLSGIKIVEDTKRYYPNANLASQVLGFTGDDNQGLDGIEIAFDNYLKGIPGRVSIPVDAAGRKMRNSSQIYYEPTDGFNVVLTIDEVIQHFAEKALDDAVKEHRAKSGTAIVMDVKTGEILAMANRPDYDPNNPFQGSKDELFKLWRNKAIADVYEPGSTFKVITAAAALEEGKVTPDEVFYDSGYIVVAGQKIKCWRWYKPHGKQTFVEAVQNSCNPVFVTLSQRLGKETFFKYINAFGFGDKTGIELPGEAKGILPAINKVGPVELSTISFGQGITATPLQLITAISAIANNGKLMKPHIVKAIVDNNKNVIKEYEPQIVRQVVSEKTSQTLRGILERVVTYGTGRSAYIEGYRVAGKTGTSEKYQEGKYIASFVGFAPADNPVVSVLVVIDEPNSYSYYGGTIAAPVAKQILEDTLRYLDVKPQDEGVKPTKNFVEVPEIRKLSLKEADKRLSALNLQYVIEGSGGLVLDQVPKPGVKVEEGSTVILYLSSVSDEEYVLVPNVLGKDYNEAQSQINSLGLKFKGIGKGKAFKQNPLPGTRVKINSTITVEFK